MGNTDKKQKSFTHIKFSNGQRYVLDKNEDVIFNQYYITVLSGDIATCYPHSAIVAVSWGHKK